MSSDGHSRRHFRFGLGKKMTAAPDESFANDDLLKECPDCAESVYVFAERCRHCGTAFPVPA